MKFSTDFLDEIRARGKDELEKIANRRASDLAKIAAELESRVAVIRAEGAKATATEIARDRAQRIAAAHLAARRVLYDAREERLEQGLAETRELLAGLCATPRYSAILRRMVAAATFSLGPSARISGRGEDAPLLSRLAGKGFDPTPRTITGGILAESEDGRRRLNLSFEELLRQHSDGVRGLLA